MVLVRTCCCGCSLRTGSILITLYYVINSLNQIAQGNLLLFSVILLLTAVLGFVAVLARMPKLLIPLIIMVFIQIVAYIVLLLLALLLGVIIISLAPKYASYAREQITNQYRPLTDLVYASEGSNAEEEAKTLIVLGGTILIFQSILSAYFDIVLISYFQEMQEDLLLYPGGVRPMQQPFRGPYGVDPMARGGPMGNPYGNPYPYPQQPQSSKTDSESESETETILVHDSGSVEN